MKKTITRVITLSLVAVMLCMALASCGGLSGKYVYKVLGQEAGSFEFKGSKVTYTVLGQEIEGTYEIKDDKISFDFTGDDEDDSNLGSAIDSLTGEVAFEKGDDYIKIAGIKYEKAED